MKYLSENGKYEIEIMEYEREKPLVFIKVPFEEYGSDNDEKRIIKECKLDENKYDIYWRSTWKPQT